MIPPSTTSAEPVTNDDASEARKRTQRATSWTVPSRPSAPRRRRRRAPPPGRPPPPRTIGERRVMLPGQTQFARTPRGATRPPAPGQPQQAALGGDVGGRVGPPDQRGGGADGDDRRPAPHRQPIAGRAGHEESLVSSTHPTRRRRGQSTAGSWSRWWPAFVTSRRRGRPGGSRSASRRRRLLVTSMPIASQASSSPRAASAAVSAADASLRELASTRAGRHQLDRDGAADAAARAADHGHPAVEPAEPSARGAARPALPHLVAEVGVEAGIDDRRHLGKLAVSSWICARLELLCQWRRMGRSRPARSSDRGRAAGPAARCGRC